MYLALQLSGVQTYLTNKISGSIGEDLNAKISIKGVDVSFFNKVILEEVYIEDQQGDTLLCVGNIVASINSIKFSHKKLELDKVLLDKANFNLKVDTLGELNLQFIIDALKSDDVDTTKPAWKIYCDNIAIQDSKFKYKTPNKSNKDYGISFSDLDLKNLNVAIENLNVINDTINFNIEGISFLEKSGFKLNKLSALTTIKDNGIFLDSLKIITDNTSIETKFFEFKFKSVKDFSDYTSKVKMKSDFLPSEISFNDIAYFAPGLKGFDLKLMFSGLVKGPVKDLKSKNFEIVYGKETYLNGDININGLPYVDETFIYANIKRLTSNKSDIEKIEIPPYDLNKTIKLPSYIKEMGTFDYKGKFTGFFSDFVAYGDIKTDVGLISSDILFKQDENNVVSFSGNLKTYDLDVGQLSGNDESIGLLTLNAKIKGSGKADKFFKATLDGMINKIDVFDYSYKNVGIEGELSNKKFDGALIVNDPNIEMTFLGGVDFSTDMPVFDFTADVKNADLNKLNIDKRDSVSSLSLILTAKFTGIDADNIEGNIDLYNTNYKSDKGDISLDVFTIKSVRTDSIRIMDLKSDFIDASLIGNYNLASLNKSFNKLLNFYLPSCSYLSCDIEEEINNEFKYEIDIKNTKKLSDIFYNSLYLSNGSKFSGHYNSANNSFSLNGDADEIKAFGSVLTEMNIDAVTENGVLNADIESKKFSLSNNLNLHDFKFNANMSNDTADVSLLWENPDTVNYSGEIYATTFFTRQENRFPIIDIEFIPSYFIIADTIWYVNDNKIQIDSTSIAFNDFTINNNDQYLYLDGKISELDTDSLSLMFNGLNLSNINVLTKNHGFEIGGFLNGEAKLSSYYTNLSFTSDVVIDNLSVNKEVIGNTSVKSFWDQGNNKIHFDVFANRGKIKTINIVGDYYADISYFDMDLSLNKLRLNVFEPYINSVASDIRGIASGEVKIKGKPDAIETNGQIKLQKTSFSIDYLNTRYNLETSLVDVENNKFSFNDIKMFEYKSRGDFALASGELNHDNFKNLNFNVRIDAKNFFLLNTEEKDNSLYYGKAYATGIVNISGTPSNVVMDISAKTEKNTSFFIPLYTSEEVGESNFVTFVGNDLDVKVEEEELDLSGVQLNFDLDVTPDAEVQLIFDSQVGDVIRGKGAGNINMEINTLGKFNMSGEYVIEDGDYLFTLQNIINKRFNIQKGSNIKWNGDPYEAIIDMDAIYNLKTSIRNLTQDTIDSDSKRIPIECQLNMTNKLMSPDIKFGINAPSSGDKVESVISKLSEDELNKQFLALLMINSFVTPDYLKGQEASTSSSNAVGMNSSELLSNQLSNWLSQISDDFDIGFTYRPGDEISSNEIELAISTQLLNDRVSINGNVGKSKFQNTNNMVGDVNVEVKVFKSGKLRLRGFNRSNDNLVYNYSRYTQGLGIFYRKEFNSIFKRKKKVDEK